MNQTTTDLADELRAEHYKKTGYAWLTVRTGSMEPIISSGDNVLISAVTAGDISPGEIIVFRRNGSLIGHRVLKKRCTGDGICFIEKGDNSDIYGSFQGDDVIGRVIAVKGGKKFLSLNTVPGRLAGKVLLVWFFGTSAVRNRLDPSRGKVFRKFDSGIVRLSHFITGLLMRICCAVSHPGREFQK